MLYLMNNTMSRTEYLAALSLDACAWTDDDNLATCYDLCDGLPVPFREFERVAMSVEPV